MSTPDPDAGRGNRGRVRRVLVRIRAAAKWTVVICGAVALGELGQLAGFPAAHLVVSLLLGSVLALSGLVRERLPSRMNLVSQSVLGLSMGTYLTVTVLGRIAGSVLPLLAITVATVLISLVIALAVARTGWIDRISAALGMVPGGSAAVVACADDVNADARLVAVMQYLRLAVVAVSAPTVIQWVLPSGSAPADRGSGSSGDGPWQALIAGAHSQVVSVMVVAILILVGRRLGRLIRLPSAALLGPMLVATIVTLSTVDLEIAPAGALEVMVFTVVGLDVGLRFTRDMLRRLRPLLPLVLACTVLVNIAVGLLAWLLSALTAIPLPDALLATTPGGINAVLATAESTGSDVGLISSVQSLRLFLMMLLVPLVKLWATRQARPST